MATPMSQFGRTNAFDSLLNAHTNLVRACSSLADMNARLLVQRSSSATYGGADDARARSRPTRREAPELSDRANDMLGVRDTATDNYKEVYDNKYHPTHNPIGKINMCTAENIVCEDLLFQRFSQADLWTPNFEHVVHYPVAGGFVETKRALLPYFERFLKARVREDDLVLAPGCTAAYDMLAFCLCDPGDCVLSPAPYYGRITNDFAERAGADVIPVPFMDPFHPNLDCAMFESVYKENVNKVFRITAVVLVNPQNPQGGYFAKDEIIAICDWAAGHNMCVIVDEIFASSVYYNPENYQSFLSYRQCIKQPDKVIWMWGFSKDLCMPGLKFSVVHTENRKFVECLKRLEIMQPCPPLAQDFVVKFLKDLDWVDGFHKENLRRLQEHARMAIDALTKMGIPFLPCNSGFYLYCNFLQYLESDTFDSERVFWRKLCDSGVHLSTGKYFQDPQPGWMRLVFTCSKQELIVGLGRIEAALKKIGKRSDHIKKWT